MHRRLAWGIAAAAVQLLALAPAAPAAEPDPGIAAFWKWWAGAQPRVEQALQANGLRALADELDSAVARVDRDLHWEIGGKPGDYTLTLSPEGNFRARRRAQLWVDSAPEAPGWRFFPARQRAKELNGLEIALGGASLKMRDVRFAIRRDDARARLDVTLCHSALARLQRPQRISAAFLVLDSILGEDDVARWIGRVRAEPTTPPGAVDAANLRAQVDSLAGTSHGELFSVFQSTKKGRLSILSVNLALRRLDHLDHDAFLKVLVPAPGLSKGGGEGLQQFRRTKRLEEELRGALGGDATYVGHLVEGDSVQVMFYADAEKVRGKLAEWAKANGARTEWKPDPQWAELAKF